MMEMETPQGPGGTVAQGGRESMVETKPNGPVAAVMLAAGIGAFVLGLLTTLSEASEGVHDFLELSERVGPLSGKVVFASAAFFASWGGLHMALRDRDLPWRPVVIGMLVLLAIALVLTFPPFFQLFKDE
jgi:hypothetical protein